MVIRLGSAVVMGLTLASGCTSALVDDPDDPQAASVGKPGPGAKPTRPGESPLAPGASTPGATIPGAPGNPLVPAPGTPGSVGMGGAVVVPKDASLLPIRVRRLSNFEYDRSIAVLFQSAAALGKGFASDFRQSDFTQNASQQVDSTYAKQLQSAAGTLAKDGLAKLLSAAGCTASQGEMCASQFISSFGTQAYRRPLLDAEKTGLLAVFRIGAMGATFNDGLELVISAMLQSPSFLYVTELGEGTPKAGTIRLGSYEIASALAFLVTGGPPDAPLLMAAAQNKLGEPIERDKQARRLMGTAGAKLQVQRFVKEWLGIDKIESTGKDKTVYPKYDDLRPLMLKEADSFITEAVFNDEGGVTKLLSADYTMAEGALSQFYGLGNASAGKRLLYGTSPRRGILMQAGFLSVHAHDDETAPVKRGNTILLKVLCVRLPLPGELNLKIVPPQPDPKKTTRERFTIHAEDPACAGCHKALDPFGFALENLDGMGGLRNMENGKPVLTTANLAAADVMGMVRDGTEMATKLAASAEARSCYARNVFRFSAAQSGDPYEAMFFQSVWDKMAPGKNLDVKEILAAYAASEMFVTRRIP